MGAIRVNGCFQYLAQNNQVDIGAFTMKVLLQVIV